MSQQHAPIGVFDSGIGGLTVANAIYKRLPRESIYYVADTARVPYGPQPPERIRQYAFEITEHLQRQGAKLIVVACNTAVTAALSELRAAFPTFLFVGMEPAVKPAARLTRNGRVGVLATQATLTSERYASLMQRFARGVQVWQDPCTGLVPLIEAGLLEDATTEALLRDILAPWQAQEVDTIVLGCTHYPLVSSLIRKIVGPSVTLIDPAPAAAQQVERLLEQHGLLRQVDQGVGALRFLATGNTVGMEALVPTLFAGAAYSVQHLPLAQLIDQ